MTIELWGVLSLLALHYVGDFQLQTSDMALNKSTSNKWLSIHVAYYIMPFALFYGVLFLIYGDVNILLLGIVANFVLHWMTDYVTSRISSYYHKRHEMGAFFKTIGFDQMIHMVCLFSIHSYLFGS